MKTLKLIIIGIAISVSGSIQAQIIANIAIGIPSPWSVQVYEEPSYYFLPGVDAYYDVRSDIVIYYGGGLMVHRAYYPSYFRGYNYYGGRFFMQPEHHGYGQHSFYNNHKMKNYNGNNYQGHRDMKKGQGKEFFNGKAPRQNNSNKNFKQNGNYKSGGQGNNMKNNSGKENQINMKNNVGNGNNMKSNSNHSNGKKK